MVRLAFDDTDSLKGMCTTFLATEMMREFDDLDLIGYPRLVRLNPNVPWKTRGNAALCLRLGYGGEKSFKVGEIGGHEVRAWSRCESSPSPEDVLPRAVAVLEKWAEFGEELTNPAVAVFSRQPPQAMYWRAVRDVVKIPDAEREADRAGMWRAFKNGRGIVGCVGAAAWRPRDKTYEILSYRQSSRWGTNREIDDESVMRMDKRFPSTFNNYDYLNRKVTIAPSSPCPILFGIRANSPDDLEEAMRTVKSEKADRWVIFETNQGTDEHLVRGVGKLRSHTSVVLEGIVDQSSKTVVGGHVIFHLDRGGGIDCAVYEPSKQFRRVARALMPGDQVEVYGSVRDEPRAINVEKLRVARLMPTRTKTSNPKCRSCGKRMKSVGRGAGFRCLDCGTKAPSHAGVWKTVRRSLKLGWYEPPVSARRHISMPLSRKGVKANRYPPR